MYGSASTRTCARAAVSRISGCVFGIDLHVILRKVAPPGLGLAGPQAQLRGDLDLGLLKGAAHAVEVYRLAGAAGEHLQAAHPHGEPVERQLRAGVAERADDPPPVGVPAVDG